MLARIDGFGDVGVREAGHIVYRNRGVADPTRIPRDWLESAGLRVLISLKRHGLVICRRRDDRWARPRARGRRTP